MFNFFLKLMMNMRELFGYNSRNDRLWTYGWEWIGLINFQMCLISNQYNEFNKLGETRF